MAEMHEQMLRLWKNLNKKQRYLIIASAALVFLAIIGWSFWWGTRTEYVPLFTGLDAKDAGEVAAKLKEKKIVYELGNNGTSIMVSSKDVYQVRLDLASEGLPKGSKGFEIFDQNKFGTTDFQNKVYYLQALQGELTRTIEQMAEVEKARVHIVLPEDSLYKKNEKQATASIMVKLRPSTKLSRAQVKGIVNLVAHSIQGLKPENITVIDNFAQVLNEQDADQQMTGSGTVTQIELTKKVQDDLQKNAQSLLEQVLGPGKAAVRVNVELSFDQKTVDRQVFEPVVDDKGIVRSSQEINENFKGSNAQPGGVAGTSSNIPGYATNSNGQSNYEKKDVTRNYEINETKEKTVVAPGAIKRLTVSVLVDGAVDSTQQASIMKTISAAVGVNPTRGDVVTVESIAFSTDVADKMRQEEEAAKAQQTREMLMKYGAVAIAIIAILYLLYLHLKRKRQAEEEAAMLELGPQAFAMDEDEDAEEVEEASPEEQERLNQREAITQFAKSRPEEVAQLIRTWVNEE
ncbi:MAG: fliF [Firmicutes bacterium]|nr:fliF [Bacillota bacterium]